MLRLSKAQCEMVQHRLGVPECMAESLADAHGGDPQQYEAAAERLDAALDSGQVACESDVERLVLQEAVEGSTWWACMKCDCNDDALVMGRVTRTVESATRKVEQYLGLEPDSLIPVLY